MKLFNSKSLAEMNRDELIDIILSTGTEKHLKDNINNASVEDLRKIASITYVGEKGMTGKAKFFFFLGLILFAMFLISLIRTHWTQSIVELIIAVFSFSISSFLHIRKGIKSTK